VGVGQEEGRSGKDDGGKIEWKLSEVNTRGHSKLIEFKMAAGDVISIRGRL
jgi:hypothetical protein